ncbi:stage 0 sporulation protein [Candidatus Peregrinibacteria bacterium]|nr:stage 0 sporulation protein [Candidatus Peregrinibacteria bacterium]
MKVIAVTDQFTRKEIQIPWIEAAAELTDSDFIVYHDEERRENIGRIFIAVKDEKNKEKIHDDYSFLRKATAHDLQKMEMMKNQADEAGVICKQKIGEHKLDMQLIFTEFSLDGSRVNFIFTSDDRVDFRELVKDLAKTFNKQIHLQQIGPRDKARAVSGRGKCGKCLCCCCWLKDLSSITMDMVRSQSLESKGSSKLSGCCGKLMCCLRYEVSAYKDLMKNLPKAGSIVKVAKGEGQVTSLDVLNQKVKVVFADRSFEIVHVDDIKKVIKAQEIENINEKDEVWK